MLAMYQRSTKAQPRTHCGQECTMAEEALCLFLPGDPSQQVPTSLCHPSCIVGCDSSVSYTWRKGVPQREGKIIKQALLRAASPRLDALSHNPCEPICTWLSVLHWMQVEKYSFPCIFGFSFWKSPMSHTTLASHFIMLSSLLIWSVTHLECH